MIRFKSRFEDVKKITRRTTQKVAESFDKNEDGASDDNPEVVEAVRAYEWLGLYLARLSSSMHQAGSLLGDAIQASHDSLDSVHTALRPDATAPAHLQPPSCLRGLYAENPATGAGAVDRSRVVAGAARQLLAAQTGVGEGPLGHYLAALTERVLQPIERELDQNDSLTRLLRDELEDARLDYASFVRKLGGPQALAQAEASVDQLDEATAKRVQRAVEARSVHHEATEQLLGHLRQRNSFRAALVTSTLAAMVELPAAFFSEAASTFGDVAAETLPYLELCQQNDNRVEESKARAALQKAKKKGTGKKKTGALPRPTHTGGSRASVPTVTVGLDDNDGTSSSGGKAAANTQSAASASLLGDFTDDGGDSSVSAPSSSSPAAAAGGDSGWDMLATSPSSSSQPAAPDDLDALFGGGGGGGNTSSNGNAASPGADLDDLIGSTTSPSSSPLPVAASSTGSTGGQATSAPASDNLFGDFDDDNGTNDFFSPRSGTSSTTATGNGPNYNLLRQAAMSPRQQQAMLAQQQQAQMAAQMQARMGRSTGGYGGGLNQPSSGSAADGNDLFFGPSSGSGISGSAAGVPGRSVHSFSAQPDLMGGGPASGGSSSPFGGLAGMQTSQQQQHQQQQQQQRQAGSGIRLASSTGAAPKHYQQIAKEEAEIAKRHAQLQAQDAATDNELRRKERAAQAAKVQAMQEKKRQELAAKAAQDQDRLEQKDQLSSKVNQRVAQWAGKGGRANNLRALLSTLDSVLWDGASWKPVALSDLMDARKVRRAWLKAAAVVHPDKMTNESLENQMIAECVFATLRESFDEFKKEL